MFDFLFRLFDTSDFPARWYCGNWTAGHGYLHIGSDLATWAAYMALPCVLAYFALKRDDIVYPKILWLFAVFIFACGTVHLIEASIFWWPAYRVSGVVKLVTAAASWLTVLALVRIVPQAMELPQFSMVMTQLQEESIARKKAQHNLEERDRRTQIILESAIDAVILMSDKGHVTQWNPQAETIMGWTAEEAIGQELAELFIPPKYRDQHRSGLQRFLETGEGPILNQRLELTALRRSGQEFPVELTIIPFQLSDQWEFCAFVRDISELKEAERIQGTLSALAESSADAIIGEDLEGTIISWNREAENLFGYESSEIVGESIMKIVPEELQEELTAALSRVTTGDSIRDWETMRKRKDGTQILVSVTISPIYNRNGDIIGVSSIDRDLTERQKYIETLRQQTAELENTNEQLLKMKDRAETANQTKSQFLANMSHELRTPLNAIIGYSEMMLEDIDRGEQESLPDDLEKIRKAGRHLLELINDVLDLSKIEAGKMELFVEEINPESFVTEIVETVAPLAKANTNQVMLSDLGPLPNMVTDRTKLRQILFNVLSNASKFTENGRIDLSVKTVQMSAEPWIEFTIQDTGIGMTEEQLDSVFDAFSQAEQSTSRKYGGTGLGLAIVGQFSQMLGGNYEVTSQLGEGTTFTIRLPQRLEVPVFRKDQDEAPLAETSASAETSESEDRETVLVIDDDPRVHDMLTRFLSRDGLKVVTASNGVDGLEKARKLRPMAITLDLLMPSMDGWAVFRELKDDPELCEIPVVILSIVDDQEMGFALGVSNYLTKPIEMPRLASLLKQYRSHESACSLLVVDDDADTRMRIAEAMAEEGWSVVEAGDGQQGLDQLNSQRPDLIVLDLLMPGVDGFEFMSELRKNEKWQSIPVVVVTAKDLTQEERERLSGRVESIIQKNASRGDELLEQIRKYLRQRPLEESDDENDQTSAG